MKDGPLCLGARGWRRLALSGRRLHRVGLALAALSVSCCLDAMPPEDDVTPDEVATLEVGTGTFRFEPIETGEALPLIRGAQGGWHIWVAVRVHGVEDDSGSFEVIHYPVDAPDDPVRISHGIRLDPPNIEGFRSYVGWPAIPRDAACAVGGLYRVQVTFRPASGGRLTAERDVLVTAGDIPPPPCEP